MKKAPSFSMPGLSVFRCLLNYAFCIMHYALSRLMSRRKCHVHENNSELIRIKNIGNLLIANILKLPKNNYQLSIMHYELCINPRYPLQNHRRIDRRCLRSGLQKSHRPYLQPLHRSLNQNGLILFREGKD